MNTYTAHTNSPMQLLVTRICMIIVSYNILLYVTQYLISMSFSFVLAMTL